MESKLSKITMITALCVFCFSTFAMADQVFDVNNVYGDAIYREVGEYLWKKANDNTVLYSGDRMRLRTGQAEVAFPQGNVTVSGNGELEIPVAISADGYAEAWQNDVILYFGNYDLRVKATGKPLLIKAQYGDLEATQEATFKLQITKMGAFLTVLSGKVNARHGSTIQVVSAGQQASLDPKAIRVHTARVALK